MARVRICEVLSPRGQVVRTQPCVARKKNVEYPSRILQLEAQASLIKPPTSNGLVGSLARSSCQNNP